MPARMRAALLATAALAAISPEPARAQEDSVTVVAGAHYEAGAARRALLGSRYRELWTTPIRVPVLSPDTFAGGLTVLRRGTSPRTLSILFRGADGREYFFRSVDKEQRTGIEEDFRNTLIADIAQDLVSAKHPGAAIVVAPLLEAAGVLHPEPKLAVMADHPLLGEHRELFAGMLGMIEERPEEGEGNSPGFAGFERVIGSERLLERLEESPEDRADSRAFLAARLMDVLVGDWDRHPDQWRWGEEERSGTRFWLPIPRDRDNAFHYMDGLAGLVGGALRSTIVRFEADYGDLYDLIHNAQRLDRLILAELPAAVWDSTARALGGRLTDQVIADAVGRLPSAWAELEAEPLARKLRARRDALPEAAARLYALMSTEVDVRATDEADHADVELFEDGSVRVRLAAAERGGGVYFDRLFLPGETREVRVHLHGGADSAVVRGPGGADAVAGRGRGGSVPATTAGRGRPVAVRVLGGGGDDVLLDLSQQVPGGLIGFYDHRGDNRIEAGPRTLVDLEPYEPPESSTLAEDNPPPPRDWGSERSLFSPRGSWTEGIGPVAGGGPAWTRYGFRRLPYASRARLALLYAPLHGRFGVEADARFLRTGGGGEAVIRARASRIARTNFHGYGNRAPRAPEDLERVWAGELALELELAREVGAVRLAAGPLVGYTDPEPRPGSLADLADVVGDAAFGAAGARLEASLDRRGSESYPRRGLRASARLTGYPLAWGDAPGAFAKGAALLAGYLPLPGPLEPTLALRAGGERTWGPAPFQHAAFVGGSSSLRGHGFQRFAGDAAAHGSAELRTTLGRVNLLLVRGDLGAIALADAGRVVVSGERSGRWHSAFGGGLWFGTLGRAFVGHLVYARGERHMLHAGIGMPW